MLAYIRVSTALRKQWPAKSAKKCQSHARSGVFDAAGALDIAIFRGYT